MYYVDVDNSEFFIVRDETETSEMVEVGEFTTLAGSEFLYVNGKLFKEVPIEQYNIDEDVEFDYEGKEEEEEEEEIEEEEE